MGDNLGELWFALWESSSAIDSLFQHIETELRKYNLDIQADIISRNVCHLLESMDDAMDKIDGVPGHDE